jgi:hypothetical protein
MNKKLSLIFLSSVCLFAAEKPITPEVVEKQLEDAEAEFQRAKKMFNPWYTGPLLAPSAHIIPPGLFNIQPYLFFTNNRAKYNEEGHSKDIPNLHVLNPVFLMQFGIIDWMDGIVSAQGVGNKQSGHSNMNWGDSSVSLGFGLLSEGPYRPALLISVKENLPSGKYQHLNPKKGGVDATGSGAYQTTLGLNISKVVWWVTDHPMSFRFAQSWGIPAMVHVSGYNAYGGGSGTHGKVRLGNSYSADLGYEYSFTQRWVFTLDVVYSYAQEVEFSGHRGVDAAGQPNAIGGPFNDQLSFAPGIEYNVNENLGFLGGVWFTAWGRNSLNFISGIVSFTYTF